MSLPKFPASLSKRLIALAVTGVFAATGVSAQISSAAVQGLVARAQEQGHIRVIVGLDTPARPESALDEAGINGQRAAISAAQGRVAAAMGGLNAIHNFETVPYAVYEVDAAQLEQLRNAAGVTGIAEDGLSEPHLDTSATIVGARGMWRRGYDGTGYSVAVLDTGIFYRNRAFATAIAYSACFSTNDSYYGATSLCRGGVEQELGGRSAPSCGTDVLGCGHGTHTAGTVAGDFPRWARGIAYGAQLVPMQVFSQFPPSYCDGVNSCVLSFWSDQMAALERVGQVAGYLNIASVNMSLGGGYNWADCDNDSTSNRAYAAIVNNLRAAGIAVVVSSGNNYYDDAVGFPGCLSGVITVGATDDNDQIAEFSNQADGLVELMAPGVAINAAYFTGRRAMAELSGTSMAAPHVAAAFAMLRQVKPTATVDEMLHALQCTGTPVTRVGTPGTFYRIDVNLARMALLWSGYPGC